MFEIIREHISDRVYRTKLYCDAESIIDVHKTLFWQNEVKFYQDFKGYLSPDANNLSSMNTWEIHTFIGYDEKRPRKIAETRTVIITEIPNSNTWRSVFSAYYHEGQDKEYNIEKDEFICLGPSIIYLRSNHMVKEYQRYKYGKGSVYFMENKLVK